MGVSLQTFQRIDNNDNQQESEPIPSGNKTLPLFNMNGETWKYGFILSSTFQNTFSHNSIQPSVEFARVREASR